MVQKHIWPSGLQQCLSFQHELLWVKQPLVTLVLLLDGGGFEPDWRTRWYVPKCHKRTQAPETDLQPAMCAIGVAVSFDQALYGKGRPNLSQIESDWDWDKQRELVNCHKLQQEKRMKKLGYQWVTQLPERRTDISKWSAATYSQGSTPLTMVWSWGNYTLHSSWRTLPDIHK